MAVWGPENTRCAKGKVRLGTELACPAPRGNPAEASSGASARWPNERESRHPALECPLETLALLEVAKQFP
jgi:hypothetical protein